MSNMENYNLDTMDDMELFAVIDSTFIYKIDLHAEKKDFPKITYEDSKIMLCWSSEIFGFNLNLTRPYTDRDFFISK